jgi:hypothetical protein
VISVESFAQMDMAVQSVVIELSMTFTCAPCLFCTQGDDNYMPKHMHNTSTNLGLARTGSGTCRVSATLS